ncbi:MAG: peptide transporter, partial [Synergistaceae bacterium]|nr:peptide transporter [Synergistaceae bacterium]
MAVQETRRHVKALEPNTLILSLLVSAFAGIICMQIISRIGITPNTSIIGALLAMTLARIPIESMGKFRSLDRQNLVQTMTSAAGFGAANCTLLAVAIFYCYGDHSLIIPMLIGSGIATLIGMHLVYRLFDSELFPATGTWPPGIATAQALIAGDEGGRKGKHLLMGVFLGAVGSSKFLFSFPALGIAGLPMAGVGIAFIANVYAMIALAIGLLIRGYFEHIAPWVSPFLAMVGFENVTDLGKTYLPHGVMIGAGTVSLIQAMIIIFRKKKPEVTAATEEEKYTVSHESVKKSLAAHVVLFGLGAVALALIGGIWAEMPMDKLIVWIVWCTFSSIVAPILVGLSAMHSGWFPGFAVSIIFLS